MVCELWRVCGFVAKYAASIQNKYYLGRCRGNESPDPSKYLPPLTTLLSYFFSTPRSSTHAIHSKAPEFGARVKVLFDDGEYYWGTINSRANLRHNVVHRKGRWSVLFDDCTRERFHDGDNEGARNVKSSTSISSRTPFGFSLFLSTTVSHTGTPQQRSAFSSFRISCHPHQREWPQQPKVAIRV